MAKHKHKHKKKHERRNAAPAAAAPRRRALKRAPLPGWKDTLAAVLGGGGSAFISGLAINQKLVKPETGAAVLIAAGGATALLTEGTSRVVGNSMASAGAGQLALALMQRSAVKQPPPEQRPEQARPAAQALPAATTQPTTAPRGADFGSGYVTALFRDAANDLADLEDEEWRMGVRDADVSGADVYDFDDLAAA